MFFFCFDFLFSFFLLFGYSFVGCCSFLCPIELTYISIMYRGSHVLRFYWCGIERCIACRLCDLICPSLAIEVRCSVSLFGFRFADLFTISYRRCIYCGFCMHLCPTDAITHIYFLCVLFSLALYLLTPKFLLYYCCFVVFDFFFLCF